MSVKTETNLHGWTYSCCISDRWFQQWTVKYNWSRVVNSCTGAFLHCMKQQSRRMVFYRKKLKEVFLFLQSYVFLVVIYSGNGVLFSKKQVIPVSNNEKIQSSSGNNLLEIIEESESCKKLNHDRYLWLLSSCFYIAEHVQYRSISVASRIRFNFLILIWRERCFDFMTLEIFRCIIHFGLLFLIGMGMLHINYY